MCFVQTLQIGKTATQTSTYYVVIYMLFLHKICRQEGTRNQLASWFLVPPDEQCFFKTCVFTKFLCVYVNRVCDYVRVCVCVGVCVCVLCSTIGSLAICFVEHLGRSRRDVCKNTWRPVEARLQEGLREDSL